MARSRHQPVAQPVVVRAGFGGEAAVAALGHLADVHLQPLLALVAVQPEQRAELTAGLGGQLTEFLLEGSDAIFGAAGLGFSRRRLG